MNIWLAFYPGSGASFIEMILRSCTDLNCLPCGNHPLSVDNDCVTAHNFSKQWHPKSKKELLLKQYKNAAYNIFTPIVPMTDMTGKEVLEYINQDSGVNFYIGPCSASSAEFAAIASQKVPNYPDFYFSNTKNMSKWNDIQSMQKWELREYLSLNHLQWFIPHMQEQWDCAKQLEFICIDIMDVFKSIKAVIEEKIIDSIGCNIVDKNKFIEMCNTWSLGQDKIWQDWENYVKYKNGETVSMAGDIVQEAMIQYHLREQGIELKCYGLNTFPNSEELKQYYE